VLWYGEKKSVIQVQRRYRRKYGEQSIKWWLEQFQEAGSVLHKRGAGRPSVHADTVEMVREAFQRSPSKSTRRASRERQIPRSTVQKILHRRLKLHAYKIQIVQALEPDNGRTNPRAPSPPPPNFFFSDYVMDQVIRPKIW
jgi:hypothetical protein